MEERFSSKVAYLNALMQVLVIVQHANNLYLYPGASAFAAWIENTICYNLCEVNVPLLMALSGFLLYRNLTPENMRAKLLRRIRSLMIPYLIFNTIYFLFFAATACLPGLNTLMVSTPPKLGVTDVLRGIFLYGSNPAAWFLLQLMLMTALCPIIYRTMRSRFGAIVFLTVAFVLNFIQIRLGSLRTESFFHYLLGAAAGMHLRERVERPFGTKGQIVGFCGFLLYEMLCIWDFATLKVLRLSIFLIAVYVMADGIDWRNHRPALMRPFFAYLTHMLVLGCVRILLSGILSGGTKAFPSFLLTIVLTMAICEVLGSILERRLPTLYGILTGGRTGRPRQMWMIDVNRQWL